MLNLNPVLRIAVYNKIKYLSSSLLSNFFGTFHFTVSNSPLLQSFLFPYIACLRLSRFALTKEAIC